MPNRYTKASANRLYCELRKQNDAGNILGSSLPLHGRSSSVLHPHAPAILLQYYITNIVYMRNIILVMQASAKINCENIGNPPSAKV